MREKPIHPVKSVTIGWLVRAKTSMVKHRTYKHPMAFGGQRDPADLQYLKDDDEQEEQHAHPSAVDEERQVEIVGALSGNAPLHVGLLGELPF